MFEYWKTAFKAEILNLSYRVQVLRGKDEIEPLKELNESNKMKV